MMKRTNHETTTADTQCHIALDMIYDDEKLISFRADLTPQGFWSDVVSVDWNNFLGGGQLEIRNSSGGRAKDSDTVECALALADALNIAATIADVFRKMPTADQRTLPDLANPFKRLIPGRKLSA